MRLARRLTPKTSIDMTPLIDVIMQLIIFFMITTTFRTAPGLALNLPGSSTARPLPQEELRVVVLSSEELYVDGTQVELAGLDRAVAEAAGRLRAKRGSATPGAAGDGAAAQPLRAVVEGEGSADYQLVVSVLDALRKSGIEGVALATKTGGPGK